MLLYRTRSEKKLRPPQEAATAHSGHTAASSEPSCIPLKTYCLQIRKERIEEATKELEGLRAQMWGLPVTRAEWVAWLHEHSCEFRKLMTEAPEMRRSLNARISALPDLPRPSVRLRPVSEPCRASHGWAKLLEWRTGWHGLRTGSERRIFFCTAC